MKLKLNRMSVIKFTKSLVSAFFAVALVVCVASPAKSQFTGTPCLIQFLNDWAFCNNVCPPGSATGAPIGWGANQIVAFLPPHGG